MRNPQLCVAACLVFLFVTACRKKNDPLPEKAILKVFLTDYPAPYKAVNVDIQAVEITGSWGKIWIDARPGIYNLLDYSNGLDTLIASGLVSPGSLQQVRLVLGSNNTIISGGSTYTLAIMHESGLSIPVKKELEPGVLNSVTLDFDANLSVIASNGAFQLKPVIRPVETVSGSVSGRLSPGVNAVVKAASESGEEYSSQTDPLGNFLIQGMTSGNYTVTVYPTTPYIFSPTMNVSVRTGCRTNLGILQI